MQHDHEGRAEFSRGVAPLALNIGQLGGCFAYSGADWGGDRLVVSGIKLDQSSLAGRQQASHGLA